MDCLALCFLVGLANQSIYDLALFLEGSLQAVGVSPQITGLVLVAHYIDYIDFSFKILVATP